MKNNTQNVIQRWYKSFADLKGDHVVKYRFHGRCWTLRVKVTKLFLNLEVIEDGKLVWTFPITKKGVRKIKYFLNRIGDL